MEHFIPSLLFSEISFIVFKQCSRRQRYIRRAAKASTSRRNLAKFAFDMTVMSVKVIVAAAVLAGIPHVR